MYYINTGVQIYSKNEYEISLILYWSQIETLLGYIGLNKI